MGFGWEGSLVRLVPLDSARHLENAVAWLADPDVTRWTVVGDLPVTRLGEEGFFHRMEKAEGTDVVFAVETLAGEHIGFSGIQHIEQRQGVGVTGTLIGRTDLWGRGFGGDAARVRTRYAFDVLGLRLLLAESMVGNDASLKMLKSVGYVEVGRVPKRYWKRGAYRDVILLANYRPAEGGE